MQQVKIFKSDEAGLNRLELDINQWLASTGVRVVQIFGNIAPQGAPTEFEAINPTRAPFRPSDVMITVLYETVG